AGLGGLLLGLGLDLGDPGSFGPRLLDGLGCLDRGAGVGGGLGLHGLCGLAGGTLGLTGSLGVGLGADLRLGGRGLRGLDGGLGLRVGLGLGGLGLDGGLTLRRAGLGLGLGAGRLLGVHRLLEAAALVGGLRAPGLFGGFHRGALGG